jgi:protein-tyrosine phosphatase
MWFDLVLGFQSMIDIHCHVLPDLDDGPRTMDESLAMLRIAARTGTTDLVATPHANSSYGFDPAKIAALYAELSEKSAGLINLHLGCDFHLNFQQLQEVLTDPPKYTVNGRNYLMVELPDWFSFPAIRQALISLIQAGIKPIITHPERNLLLQSSIEKSQCLVEDGNLLQITGQSLEGCFGLAAQDAGDLLLKRKLVHFVASDAHDPIHRLPDLSRAYRVVSSRLGTSHADLLFIEHPRAVLWGDTISVSARRSNWLKLLQFWR